MSIKSQYGIGQYTMISAHVCMIDVLLIVIEIRKVNSKIMWNGIANCRLNQAGLDGRTRSYGARKRGDLFSLIKPTTSYLVKVKRIQLVRVLLSSFVQKMKHIFQDQECNFNDL